MAVQAVAGQVQQDQMVVVLNELALAVQAVRVQRHLSQAHLLLEQVVVVVVVEILELAEQVVQAAQAVVVLVDQALYRQAQRVR
jgi:hypothetical protein